MRSVILNAISQNAEDFRQQTSSANFLDLFTMLKKEIEELESALFGKHEHSPVYELIQIGGIVLRMLETYTDQKILGALRQIRKQHKIPESK